MEDDQRILALWQEAFLQAWFGGILFFFSSTPVPGYFLVAMENIYSIKLFVFFAARRQASGSFRTQSSGSLPYGMVITWMFTSDCRSKSIPRKETFFPPASPSKTHAMVFAYL